MALPIKLAAIAHLAQLPLKSDELRVVIGCDRTFLYSIPALTYSPAIP